mgnify:CR=1 FL=1
MDTAASSEKVKRNLQSALALSAQKPPREQLPKQPNTPVAPAQTSSRAVIHVNASAISPKLKHFHHSSESTGK